jgi:hypothetical protein
MAEFRGGARANMRKMLIKLRVIGGRSGIIPPNLIRLNQGRSARGTGLILALELINRGDKIAGERGLPRSGIRPAVDGGFGKRAGSSPFSPVHQRFFGLGLLDL